MSIVHDSENPEGIYDDHEEKTTASLARAKDRKGIAAMELYIRTRSWQTAAEGAGYPTPRAARVAAERALEKEFHDSPRSQEFMRKYASKHLDLLLRSVASKTVNSAHPEHLAAIKVARELIAQQSKLLGLDAPTKLSLVDPTQDQIDEYLDKFMPERSDVEVDFFDDIEDAEIIEDPPALEA